MKSSQKLEKLLLIVGSVLLLVYVYTRIHQFVMSRIGLWSFGAHQSKSSADHPASGQVDASTVDFTLWSENRFRAYKNALGMKLEAPLAVLVIPKLRIEVPVFEGTDDVILNRGAGRIAGTARPGDGQ